jgi:hypothetical protein
MEAVMRANPGGIVNVKDVVGREKLIGDLWRILDQNSVILEAARRVGKTSILRRMVAEAPPAWEPVYLDLESAHSAGEFAMIVAGQAYAKLRDWSRPDGRLADLLRSLGAIPEGGELRWRDRPLNSWKRLLVTAIEDLVEHQAEAGRRVVFFFNEMAWMLANIARLDGEATASEILDVLRFLRQSRPIGYGFRMLLSGSIGMHHILHLVGEHHGPLNDMMKVELPPLSKEAAIELAVHLMADEGLVGDLRGAAHAVADLTAGYPFYIHLVVYGLKKESRSATADQVLGLILRSIADPFDSLNLSHFRARIPVYYARDGELPPILLDSIAASDHPVPFSAMRLAADRAGEHDSERVRELLRLLVLDYYLIRDAEGHYAFRLPLLRLWWVIDRHIA